MTTFITVTSIILLIGNTMQWYDRVQEKDPIGSSLSMFWIIVWILWIIKMVRL